MNDFFDMDQGMIYCVSIRQAVCLDRFENIDQSIERNAENCVDLARVNKNIRDICVTHICSMKGLQ